MVSVTEKMALIQSIFIDSKEKGLSITDLNKLNSSLSTTNPEFISLGYEAAAMGVALKSIEETNSLSTWSDFYQNYGENHATQVHVGLGWALSELNLDVSAYLDNFESFLKYRVIDGYAYYDARFKRRQAVRMQEIPKNLDDLGIRAYNQGLGRCFWYLAQGEVEKLTRMISIFPEERHFDMWRGIGVAVAYVGGIEAEVMEELIKKSRNNLPAFKCGVAIATQTRVKANAVVNDTEKICELIFSSNCVSIAEKITLLEKENAYFDWLKRIEEEL
jgi:enediyne biosynthesis protein E3